MANYYTQFSILIDGTPEQLTWLENTLRAEESPCQSSQQNGQLWLYAEENGDLDHLAQILAEYQEKYDLAKPLILEWANTCSKLRTDGFGGGAVAIYKGTLEWFNPYDQASRWIAEQKEKTSLQRAKAEKENQA